MKPERSKMKPEFCFCSHCVKDLTDKNCIYKDYPAYGELNRNYFCNEKCRKAFDNE